MTLSLTSSNHAVFDINFHLILVVKYRKKVFRSKEMLDRLRELAKMVARKHGVEVIEMNGESDHIHFLLKTRPSTRLSTFVGSLKTVSSRDLKREFPDVRKKLWKEMFWSPSYCLISAGGAPLDILKRYIDSQYDEDLHA